MNVGNQDSLSSLTSDPNQIRTWEGNQEFWEYLHTVDSSLDPLDARFDTGYTVRSLEEVETGKWEGTAEVLDRNPERYDGDYDLIKMSSQTMIAGKPVRLEMTGQSVFSYETFVGDFDPEEDWYHFSLQFYNPNGDSFDPEVLSQWFEPSRLKHFGKTVLNRGRFYGLSLLFTYPADENVKLGRRTILDPRTQVILDASGGGRTTDDAQYSSTQLPLLTGDYVLVSQDLFHGANLTESLTDPQMGDVLSGEFFRAQLIFLGPGEPGNYGTHHAVGERNIRFGGSRRLKTRSHFTMVFTPPNAHERMDILAVDATGRENLLRHRTSSGGEVTFQAEIPRSGIRELRFKYRTSAKRLLIEVPLFAIPSANRGVTDLFDVTVPLVVIRNEQHWRSLVANLVQLRHFHDHHPGQIPKDIFPLVFENHTVRELLEEYHKRRPDVKINVDQKEQVLVFDDTKPFQEALEKVRNWFGRVTFTLFP